jgi:hypothetical protein
MTFRVSGTGTCPVITTYVEGTPNQVMQYRCNATSGIRLLFVKMK